MALFSVSRSSLICYRPNYGCFINRFRKAAVLRWSRTACEKKFHRIIERFTAWILSLCYLFSRIFSISANISWASASSYSLENFSVMGLSISFILSISA